MSFIETHWWVRPVLCLVLFYVVAKETINDQTPMFIWGLTTSAALGLCAMVYFLERFT